MTKRIFYFNLTLSCNNECVFCYSHNTNAVSKNTDIPFNELSLYLESHNLNSADRVILSGGEPMMHAEILDVLLYLKEKGCEVVVFSNGRMLRLIPKGFLNSNFRFVIPVHGSREQHDEITRSQNSFAETEAGLIWLHKKNPECKVDLKIILHYKMVLCEKSLNDAVEAFDKLIFNNTVHITKMAETVKSVESNCKALPNGKVSRYSKILFEHFKDKGYSIRLFDTCIADIDISDADKCNHEIKVYGKDYIHEKEFGVVNTRGCDKENCPNKEYCLSVINNYLALEYKNGKFSECVELE